MAILHGSWLGQKQGFFLWGETWRHLEGSTSEDLLSRETGGSPHPFLSYGVELRDLLQAVCHQPLSLLSNAASIEVSTPVSKGSRKSAAGKSRKNQPLDDANPFGAAWCIETIALPSRAGLPELSRAENLPPENHSEASTEVSLRSWQVEGVLLAIPDTVRVLSALPLGSLGGVSWWGEDLRFWAHVLRWALDLLARGKVLPRVVLQADRAIAQWQVLLDSATDQERFGRFVRQMPPVCQCYGLDPETQRSAQSPRQQISDFLNHLVDTSIRQNTSLTNAGDRFRMLSPALQTWVRSLESAKPEIPLELAQTLLPALDTWTAPLQTQLEQFRPCLRLVPPTDGRRDWWLDYGLQAIDDPECWVPAQSIWQHPVDRWSYAERTITQPQETLLMGLGLASRVYPVLEASLQTACPEGSPLTPVQAYEFLRSIGDRLQERGIGVILPVSLSNRGGWANRLGLKIIASTPKSSKKQRLGLQSLLNFKWQLSIGGHSLSKAEFERLVALNMPLVEINGEWVELRPQDIQAAKNFFALRKDQTTLSLEDALRLSNGDTQTIEKLPVVSFEASGALQDLMSALTDNQAIAPLQKIPGFQGTLRPYQERGAGWLAFLEQWGLGACLADDMGLGKTIQFIAFLLHLKAENLLEHPVLLVCPTSVLGNWEREVQKFAPSLKLLIHHGDKRSQGRQFAERVRDRDLVITSYALIHRDLGTLKAVAWQGVVLDEAQNIKNSEAKQSQAVRQLETQFRIALTGTPVENRLAELWSILDFLNPGYLGSKQFFQRRFAVPIERYGDTTSLQTLRSLAQPFILRRLKTDRSIIQDLPEKQEMTVFCGLSNDQAALYQTIVNTSLEEIEAAQGIQRRGIILALLTKLKQLCNHPILLDPEKSAARPDWQPFRQASGKIQRLEEMLEVVLAEGDRALIFTQFAEWGKLLKTYLEETLHQETLFLYGSTPKAQREAMVDRFQNDPQAPRLFILSLKAGGVGLNLTRANHVFHFDRWWNPAVENQATDRVFRIGQHRNVQVHKFVCSGTLEERIHDMIESKKALAEQVIGTGEHWLTELDTDQLRDLLLLDRTAILGEGN